MYVISLFSHFHTLISPSLIRLVVSVDVKHHVYFTVVYTGLVLRELCFNWCVWKKDYGLRCVAGLGHTAQECKTLFNVMWGLGVRPSWLAAADCNEKNSGVKPYQLTVAPHSTLKTEVYSALFTICRLIYELNHGSPDNTFFCTGSVGLETFDSDRLYAGAHHWFTSSTCPF